ncbi:hypothetical protein DFJ74DRAFT_696011 [Hyaloraphidium curvatum]|nr:hypothetical protein DFJ74DRAFT_696011 [Hyaloraphidium curvatum]
MQPKLPDEVGLLADVPPPYESDAGGPSAPPAPETEATSAPVHPLDAPPRESKSYLACFSGSQGRWVGRTVPKKLAATALFGGVMLDLRGAELQLGETVIDVFAMCGGVSIVVSPDIWIEVEGGACAGGFDEGRRRGAAKTPVRSDRWVSVRGFVMCGGCHVAVRELGEGWDC